MYRGTTPTYTLTFPDEIDFTMTDVYVTFSDETWNPTITKTNEELEISGNVINVYLSQEETLSLAPKSLMQVNWTYNDAGKIKRACSQIVTIYAKQNLINEVLE